MVRHNIRSLPLVRDDRIVGILTDTDLVRVCLLGSQRIRGIDASAKWHRPVADHMSARPDKIEPNASVLHAWMLMRKLEVQHLAVVRHDECVVGIVSDNDIYYAVPREPQPNADSIEAHPRVPAMSLSDIMTRKVISVGNYDKLSLAAEKMLSNDIAALLVMDYWLKESSPERICSRQSS